MKPRLTVLGLIAGAAALVGCGGGQEEAAPDEASNATAFPADSAAAGPASDTVATPAGAKLADFTPDAAHGKTLFVQCKACHSTEPGRNGIGPSLAGIVGRKAASIEGFNYSAAVRDSGLTWTQDELFRYLEQPQRALPGTKMAFAGLKSGQDRADIIAYLENPAE